MMYTTEYIQCKMKKYIKILSSMRRSDTAKHCNVKSCSAFTRLLQLAIIDNC